MKNAGMVEKAALLCMGVVLAGCASAPQRVVESVKIDLWELDKSPLLSDVISMPVEKIEDVASRASLATFLKNRKDKFETEDAFKARVASMPPIKNAFVVMPLRTYECTSYDFATKSYNVSCAGFRVTTELASEVKPTGTTKLANAFGSRDVEFVDRSSYYLSAKADAVFKLAMSSEDAKKIDNDLMIGLVFSIASADYDLGGCSKSDISILDDKTCKEIGFKSGIVVQSKKYMVIPNELLDVVVFRKSDQRVIRRETFAVKK
ncbi:MAG: hypothetical protein K9K38_11805 [Rhodoferax sp.]|nr:hypothetical protein [Rhodoferax sp.]